MLPWILCGILGAIIIFLLYVILRWRIAFRGARKHRYANSSYIVYEKRGWIKHDRHWKERWLLPPIPIDIETPFDPKKKTEE